MLGNSDEAKQDSSGPKESRRNLWHRSKEEVWRDK